MGRGRLAAAAHRPGDLPRRQGLRPLRLTTVDPDTAAKGHEPLFALAHHRRWDNKVWFGVNLIPDAPPPAPSSTPATPSRSSNSGIAN